MNILLVGAGGYGALYAKELLNPPRSDIKLEGIVDPYVSASSMYKDILAQQIPVYDTIDAFYAEHHAELAIISTPPFLHCEQSISALKHGSYVLCEKPVAPTLDEANRMMLAEKEYGKFIAIGYQWSFSDAIRELKQDILSGKLGAPIAMKTAISWPRNFAYYRRGGGWAGKIEKNGAIILDSIASNACAHYLHNMLFLLGQSPDESASADEMEADCLRANDIETFDTCSIRARVSGIPIYFIASHATERIKNPEFVYTFQNATVCYKEELGTIMATFSDGTQKNYGNPFADTFQKLWNTVDAIRNQTTPICTVKTAMAHTDFINRLHATASYIPFDKELIAITENGEGIYVKGLFERLYRAYDSAQLFSECE